MPFLLQHLLALLIVAACVALVAWQGIRAWRGRGAGCATCKGCSPQSPAKRDVPRVAFLPAELLRRRK